MRFVLEEASWLWDGTDRVSYIDRIELLLDRLDVAREREEAFAASHELLTQRIFGDLTLAELIWDSDSPLDLPYDVKERISVHLGPMRYWDDYEDWPDPEVTIADEVLFSLSAALAHTRVRQGLATACIPLPGRWCGPHKVCADKIEAAVHFVVDEHSHREFFRDALEVERVDERLLPVIAPHAFPDLYFLDDVWRGLGDFEGGYRRVRNNLHRLLSVLDDYGAWVFTDETGRLSPKEPKPSRGVRKPVTDQLIEQRFIGWGFDVAPENPNVFANRICRQARERTLEGKVLYCEWHYKLEPHINRVHLHAPDVVSAEKLIVAIFADHLPLP